MQLQNSYIFLPNPYNKKEESKTTVEEGTIYLKTKDSFINHFENIFPTATKFIDNKVLFECDYKDSINIDGKDIYIVFSIKSVIENYYLDTVVIARTKLQAVKGLEYIKSKIEKSKILEDYIEIVSYDSISEYYCNKIYPKLNELERHLRKLLFNIYVVNFGRNYYQTTISDELQNKVKGIIQAKGSNSKKEIERLQKFFYSLEFNDIQQLLFTPRWTDVDEKFKEDFLKKNKDLSKLSNEKLRTVFSEISPKSDWERFFDDKMNIQDVQQLIEEIRKSRNNIAHCKFFYYDEYSSCNKFILKLNKTIKAAIDVTEKKDFVQKNVEVIFADVIKGFEEFREKIVATLFPIAHILKFYENNIAPLINNVQTSQNVQKSLTKISDTLKTSTKADSVKGVIQTYRQIADNIKDNTSLPKIDNDK